jgi:hypothetical protein
MLILLFATLFVDLLCISPGMKCVEEREKCVIFIVLLFLLLRSGMHTANFSNKSS